MGLTVSDSGGGNFKKVPAGAHIGRCIRVIDLGTQKTQWEGEDKLTPQIQITWELHGEDESGERLVVESTGEPLIISSKYTKSLGAKSKLRAMLESWRGKPFTSEEMKGFDVSKLLGAYCMVNVTHSEKNGKTYANVAAVTALPSALAKHKPQGVLPTLMLDLDNFDEEVYMALHEKLRELIDQSVERQSAGKKKSEPAKEIAKAEEDDFSDIPF